MRYAAKVTRYFTETKVIFGTRRRSIQLLQKTSTEFSVNHLLMGPYTFITEKRIIKRPIIGDSLHN